MATAQKDSKKAAKPTRGQSEEDRAANLHELADQFGEGVGNAEELIIANTARRTADLAAIGDLPVIQSETDELDLDSLEGPNGEYVVDAAVRGSGRMKGTIVIYEDETGRQHMYLAVSNYDEAPSSGPRRSSHAKEQGEDKEAADAGAGAA
jgi:hypothetical protein